MKHKREITCQESKSKRSKKTKMVSINYDEDSDTFTVVNKINKLVFPPCRIYMDKMVLPPEYSQIWFDDGNLKQDEGENGEASTSGFSSRVNGNISPNDQISIHNDLPSSPSSSVPLVNGHCSPSPSLSSFGEVFEMKNKVKKGRGRPPKSKTIDTIAKGFRNPFSGAKPLLKRSRGPKKSNKPNTKEPKTMPELTPELLATVTKKVQESNKNLPWKKTKILPDILDKHGNKVSSTENSSKLRSSEEKNSAQNGQLPSISIPLEASSSSSTTAAGKVTDSSRRSSNSVPLLDEDDSLPWTTSNGITKTQINKNLKNMVDKINENKSINNKNGKRVHPLPSSSSSSISNEEPVFKKPKQRKTLGLKLPPPPQQNVNSKVTGEFTMKLQSSFKIPKKPPPPPQPPQLITEDKSCTSKLSRMNLNGPNLSYLKNLDDDELLGDYEDIFVTTQDETVDEVESPVDKAKSPVNGTESPVNGTESPVNGTESPVNGIESPVDEVDSPMNKIVSPLKSVEQTTSELMNQTFTDYNCPVLQIPDPDSDDSVDIYNFDDLIQPRPASVSDPIMNNNDDESSNREKEPKDEEDEMDNSSTDENIYNDNERNREKDQVDIPPINSSPTSENSSNDNESNRGKEPEDDKDQIDNSSTGDNSNNDNSDKNVIQERENSDNEDKEDDEENVDDSDQQDEVDDDDAISLCASDDDFGF